jgi:uridine kinase
MTEPLAELLVLARAGTPRAGETRVLAIDGRSGAGKSTLAAALAEELDAPSISLEQLYGGWDGLRAGIERLVADVLTPLAQGQPASVPRYDWLTGSWLAPTFLISPPILVVEGVGAGALAAAPYLSVMAWLELAEQARRARAMERDGSTYDGYWEMWSRQEDEYLRSDRTYERADLVIAGD